MNREELAKQICRRYAAEWNILPTDSDYRSWEEFLPEADNVLAFRRENLRRTAVSYQEA